MLAQAQRAEIPDARVDLTGLDLPALTRFLQEELDERPFRAKQLYRWIHLRGARDFEEMTDLSKSLRVKLVDHARLSWLTKDLEQVSTDGTIKYRFRTHDGRMVESVYMPSKDRKTLCVSSQAGCAMGCTFCATGTLGLLRNLTAGEIVSQVHQVNRDVREREGLELLRPLTNLVFMGMGEPLHNFENLKTALRILESPEGPDFSHRHITVSTVGLVPMIERLGLETDVKLAVSLNASYDEQRSKMMPVNRKWNIAALLEACRNFPQKQGRRVTFEYVLLDGVNDTEDDARRLAELVKGTKVKINLIPYNENPGLGFGSPLELKVMMFHDVLIKAGICAMVRQNRGRDIAGACGQLANLDGKSDVTLTPRRAAR